MGWLKQREINRVPYILALSQLAIHSGTWELKRPLTTEPIEIVNPVNTDLYRKFPNAAVHI